MSGLPATSEFERLLSLDDLKDGRAQRRLEASMAECQALAGRLGLESLASLTAELEIRQRRTEVRVAGRFRATLRQLCVVTLDPFDTTLAEEVCEIFTTAASVAGVEVDVDEDSPEPLEGNALDLGELVVQHLALAIDPHPRAPEAALSALEFEEQADDPAADSPFAALARLKDKK